jgi:hypothetical protein
MKPSISLHTHHKGHGKHSKHHKHHEKHDCEDERIHGSSGLKGGEFEVSLNKDNLNDLIRDFEDFGVTYWDKTEDDREVVIEALKDAWSNTAGKLIFNFGKVVVPVAEEWATIMQYVQVNPMCDQKCAVKCLNPRKRETMYFDTRCLASCKCEFAIGKIDPDKLRTMAKNLEGSLEESSEFYDDLIRDFRTIVEPRIDHYLKKEQKLHDQFGSLLEKHAVETFGCDKQCIENCVSRLEDEGLYVSFWEIPMCVKDCKCSLNELVNVEGKGKKASKRINLHHVIEEAEGDKESWELFKRNKD